ncbi:serine protease [Actinokineospora sp. 24-640]
MRWRATALAVLLAGALVTPAAADQRIVGGEEIEVERVPWTLSLQYGDSHFCGAVIVSAEVALTAAHCTDGVPAHEMSVRAGSSRHAEGGHRRAVAAVVQHPRYDAATVDNDVSVLLLADPLPLGAPGVRAAHVGTSVPRVGQPLVVTGWGSTVESGPASPRLRAVVVPMVSRTACRESYEDAAITARMLCAGYPDGGRDSCQGDSGGPLTAGATLVGLVSWGNGCARPRYYGVYTNLANPALRRWIEDNAGV